MNGNTMDDALLPQLVTPRCNAILTFLLPRVIALTIDLTRHVVRHMAKKDGMLRETPGKCGRTCGRRGFYGIEWTLPSGL